MVNVAIYLRLSDEDRDKKHKSDESESIQNQRSMLREYCVNRGWDIYDIYCDEDYSGADKSRPDFNRMIKDCESGFINVVLCKSQSRFSRDMEMVEKYIHNKFIEWGVRFIGVVDNADSANISNKKARQINGLINEWYLEDVSENIRKTLKHKREQGEFTGSFAPYGYAIDPNNKNHLIVDENVAPIVRNIFDWYLQGWGYRKIVLELNNRHIPNPTAYKNQINSKFKNSHTNDCYGYGLWTHTTIYRILRNETYRGVLVQGKTHTVSYKNKKIKYLPPEEWIRVEGTHEAIISDDIWYLTQKRIKSRARASRVTLELSPLAYKVKCEICGRPMRRDVYRNRDNSKHYMLVCASYKVGAMNCTNTHGMNGEKLEEIVLEQLNSIIDKYCQMDEIELFDNRSELIKSLTKTLQSHKTTIFNQEDKLSKLYDDKLEGVISTEQYIRYSKKYTDEIDKLKVECSSIESRISELEQEKTDLFDKKSRIKKYSHIEQLTREVAEEFIDCIYIGEKDSDGNRNVTINWNF